MVQIHVTNVEAELGPDWVAAEMDAVADPNTATAFRPPSLVRISSRASVAEVEAEEEATPVEGEATPARIVAPLAVGQMLRRHRQEKERERRRMERCVVRLEDAAFSPTLGNMVRLKYKEYLRCGFKWQSLHAFTSVDRPKNYVLIHSGN